MGTALLHPISQAFRHWVGLGWVEFRDSVKFVCKLSRICVFGIEAWRAAGMWCWKFDPVRIGRGGGHISEGIRLGGDELVANLHIVTIFSVLFGRVLVIGCVYAEVGDGTFAV